MYNPEIVFIDILYVLQCFNDILRTAVISSAHGRQHPHWYHPTLTFHDRFMSCFTRQKFSTGLTSKLFPGDSGTIRWILLCPLRVRRTFGSVQKLWRFVDWHTGSASHFAWRESHGLARLRFVLSHFWQSSYFTFSRIKLIDLSKTSLSSDLYCKVCQKMSKLDYLGSTLHLGAGLNYLSPIWCETAILLKFMYIARNK